MTGGGFTASGNDFEAKITPIVILSCIMAATGGLMFGYDVGVSGNNLVIRNFDFVVDEDIWVMVSWIRWCDIHGSIPERVFSGGVHKDSGRERVGEQLLQIRQSKVATIHIVFVPCGFNCYIFGLTHNSEAGKKSHHAHCRFHLHCWSCLQCCGSEPPHAHRWQALTRLWSWFC